MQPFEIINHEDKPVEMLVIVDSARINHYNDVVEYMVQNEINRCAKEGFTPTKSQIEFLKKELVRYAVIRQDIKTAQTLKIKKSNILNENS